jgi:uncharacterized membrane protein YukC
LYINFVKGSKKLIFIHKFPQSNSNSDVTGKKKGDSIGELGTELLELIEDDGQDTRQKPARHNEQTTNTDDDDTQLLTELEKQAEQEVNSLTIKSPKGKE